SDFMRDWLPYEARYLDLLVQREGFSESRHCSLGCGREGNWRCTNCFGRPLLCTECCRSSHQMHPFHRVEQWCGTHFAPSWLLAAGLVLNLGHDGLPCPKWAVQGAEDLGAPDKYSAEEDSDADSCSDTAEDSSGVYNEMPNFRSILAALEGNPCILVVDRRGLHRLAIRACVCFDHPPLHEQLMALGLYPASQKSPQTVFSFDLLKEFRLINLECRVAGMSFFNYLQRVTNPVFPHRPPDRYRELLRISRQWRYLQNKLKFGVAHSADKQIKAGQLANFCSTCPQPGTNLPSNWKADTKHDWKYQRSFVVDGNFSAELMKNKNTKNDVHLTADSGYFTGLTRYKEHLAVAVETQAKSTCHDHKAVNQVHSVQNHLAVTGIGAIACARHGCFVPDCVVDFQKGERQMNMDYALCQALGKLDGISRVLVLYDVACQYSIHFKDWVNKSPYLHVPANLEITWGIGLFHIHGHQDICMPRYSPDYIPGAGQVDGEILETLWSSLNEVTGSTHSMTAAHRREVLDDHMLDNNWKKMVHMVQALCIKYKRALKGLTTATHAYNSLTATAKEALVRKWTQEEKDMQGGCAHDITSMDALDVQVQRGPMRAEMQLHITKGEGPNTATGSARWITLGLKVEEMQLRVSALVKRLGAGASVTARVDLANRRRRLGDLMEEFARKTMAFLEKLPAAGDIQHRPDIGDDDDEGWVEEGEDRPEKQPIVLPSSIGASTRDNLKIAHLAELELLLWQGQANDALHQLRIDLGHRSYLYRTQVRNSKNSQQQKTKAWDSVHSIDAAIKLHSSIYWRSLGADEALLQKYQVLKATDVSSSTILIDPSLPGQWNKTLAWFWTVDVSSGDADNDWMIECRIS
ncbi:hypothetical protein HYDPIDRAFT_87159, partial [Hydnomerulius pinastri MD-312]